MGRPSFTVFSQRFGDSAVDLHLDARQAFSMSSKWILFSRSRRMCGQRSHTKKAAGDRSALLVDQLDDELLGGATGVGRSTGRPSGSLWY